MHGSGRAGAAQSRWTSVLAVVSACAALWTSTVPAAAQRRRREPVAQSATAAVASTGTLSLQLEQAGATVLIDEEPAGTTPLAPVALTPGSHTVRVRLPGFTEYSDVVQIVAGQPLELPVELFPLSEVLTIATEPSGAHVFIDGTFVGDAPGDFELSEGTRSVRIALPGYEESIRSISARAGTRDVLSVQLAALPDDALVPHETQWFEEPVTWIGIGGGAAAVAGAIAVIAVLTAPTTLQTDDFCASSATGCFLVTVPW